MSRPSLKEIMAYKPTHDSVTDPIMIEQMMEEYKNEEMRSALSALSSNYYRYRKIRGDGNCFVRAVAFSYLVALNKVDYQEVFSQVYEIDLSRIKKTPNTAYRERYYYIREDRELK